MSRDITWLKRMFFKDDTAGVIDLDTLKDLETELGTESDIGLGKRMKMASQQWDQAIINLTSREAQ